MDKIIYDQLVDLNIKLYNKIENPFSVDFHLHDTYEVLFFISGNASYFVDNNFYALKYGDLILTNTTEIHAPVFNSSETYERVIFHFPPLFARYMSTPECNLEKCFIERPNGKYNLTSLNNSQIKEFLDLYKKVEQLNKDLTSENIILKIARLTEILVFIKNSFSNSRSEQNKSLLPKQLLKVINHIDENLSDNLSLDNLGKRFFINKNYLCTLFRKHTGRTLHQYIVYRRISYAKQLLTIGNSVTETCLLCGFNDYSNFIKTFREITGKSPGSYRKSISEMYNQK